MAYSVFGASPFGWTSISTFDVLVDVIDVGGEGADGEQFLQLGENRPGLAHLARHRVELSLQPQRTHEADHGFLRGAQLIDEFGPRHIPETLRDRPGNWE